MRRVPLLISMCALVALAPVVQGAELPSAQSVIERYGLEESQRPVAEHTGWRKPQRVLVSSVHPHLAELVKSQWPDVEVRVAQDAADAVAKARDADVVLGLCTPEILRAGAQIRWIQLISAGVEHCVSIPALRERNVLVTNLRRLNGPVIAEHAIALTLALTRALHVYLPAQAQGEWRRAPDGRMVALSGKTMLIVGLGGIGEPVAQRAHALGMRVIAIRASGRQGPDYVSYVGLPDELHKLTREADVIVNTAPLTSATTGMFDAAFFAQMKPTGYFINVARGASVVTPALVQALQQNKIAGAALDVTDPEPLPAEHPLWRAPNVIITPHVAAQTDLGHEATRVLLRENLRRYAAGERMLSVVDLERGY